VITLCVASTQLANARANLRTNAANQRNRPNAASGHKKAHAFARAPMHRQPPRIGKTPATNPGNTNETTHQRGNINEAASGITRTLHQTAGTVA
jgi:hypothetical protein